MMSNKSNWERYWEHDTDYSTGKQATFQWKYERRIWLEDRLTLYMLRRDEHSDGIVAALNKELVELGVPLHRNAVGNNVVKNNE
jgi:hypothetical protein